jgi:hypothetical protein
MDDETLATVCFNRFVWLIIIIFCITWWETVIYLAIYFINKIGC